jgi:hypothetical protein
MPDKRAMRKVGGALGVALLVAIAWAKCSAKDPGGASATTSSSTPSVMPSGSAAGRAAGFSAPIAAMHVGGDVIVAALDVPSSGVRVQRINSKDEVTSDRIVLGDVAWSPDADLKLAASADGTAVTWRGLRAGKLVRQLVMLASDLSQRGEPIEVHAASCSTRDAVWSSDGAHAVERRWVGSGVKIALPKEKEVSLLCGPHRAFAVIEDDDRTSLLALGDGGAPITMMRESDFGEDDQRELSEYTVGEDVGVVRLAASGALALREIVGGTQKAMQKLKTPIGKDDDVVAVDASSRAVVIVYTQEVTEAPDATAADKEKATNTTCTKVAALRVDRQTLEESTVELSPGRCGHEVGPFFTSVLDEGVAVAWPERTGGAGHARAPIVALAHGLVLPTGTPAFARIEQPADALVDAGCDGASCYAVALTRRDGNDPLSPGLLKVVRYR